MVSVPKSKKKTSNKTKQQEREVVYPKIVADVCVGETAINIEDAKHLLGWKEASEEETYVKEIYSLAKIKVVCTNNITNRPIYTSVVQTLKQEILRGRWKFNGEPIIVGRTELILNGQHTLLALILANLEWESDPDRWAEYWPTAPTIEKIVVSGVDESDNTVNTMDTCKPRSLSDVIYRSDYFDKLLPGERRTVAKMTEYAIRLLWLKTGAKLDAFAPLLTHAEALAFLSKHPRLLEAVQHVHEENGKEGLLRRYVSPGYMAGLLYLMGCSSTDPAEYRGASHPSEETLEWSQWEKACDFVVLLAAGGKETVPIRAVMARSIEEGNLGNAERWSIIASAWIAYSEDKKITPACLKLDYLEDDDGNRRLSEQISVGGIDLGDPSTADESMLAMSDPKPEEIAKEAAKLKSKGLKQMQEVTPAKTKSVRLQPSRSGFDWEVGDVAWVKEEDGDHYLGKLIDSPWVCDDKSKQVTVRDSKGGEWEVSCSDLSLEDPKEKKVVTRPKTKTTVKSKGIDKEWKLKDKAWVEDNEGNHWQGTIIELTKNGAKLKVGQGFQGCGTTKMVWQRFLRKEQPNGKKTV